MVSEELKMLRVTVIQESGQVVRLRVEGDVKGLWVAELRRACEDVLSRDVRLILDLAGVSFVDLQGTALFAALRARHVDFANASSFIAEQLGGSNDNGH
jgi:anti-anti-sigma regulatory factor